MASSTVPAGRSSPSGGTISKALAPRNEARREDACGPVVSALTFRSALRERPLSDTRFGQLVA